MSYQLLALDVRDGSVQVVATDLSLAEAYRRLAAEAAQAGDGIPQYQGRTGLAVARSAEGGPLRVFEEEEEEDVTQLLQQLELQAWIGIFTAVVAANVSTLLLIGVAVLVWRLGRIPDDNRRI